MPKTSYKVALSDGTFATRKSDRVYTHIVVGRRSYEKELADASTVSKGQRDTLKSNFAYYTKIAAGNDPYPSTCYRTEPKWTAEEVAEEKARAEAENAQRFQEAVRKIDGHTLESFIEADRLYHIRKVEERKTKGYYNDLLVVAWCGRLDLAHKQVSANSHLIDVAIVPVAQ